VKVGTIQTLYGRRAGAELLMERTILGLARAFDDVACVVYCNAEAMEALPSNAPGIETRYVPWLDNQFKKAYWLEFAARGMVEGDGLDVFWVPSGTNSFPGKWRIPSLVTFLDLGEYFVRNKYDFKRTLYRKRLCVPRSLRRACAFTTISQSGADDLRKLFAPRQPCHVVYPGPSPRDEADRTGRSTMTADEARAVEGLEEVFFCPGRTDYAGKGLDVLVRAFARFHAEEDASAKLVLVGPEGMNHDRLLRDISDLGLQTSVLYLGRVSDEAVDALYRKSRAVVYASRYEGFGFPVLEAMSHDVPLICSRTSSLPEVAGDGALFFDIGDAEDLCRCMKRMHGDDALAGRLAAAGQRQLKRFSWDKSFSEMRRVLMSVAGCPPDSLDGSHA
jgi:glycosyltransferase involved in cell wall biosynthesis